MLCPVATGSDTAHKNNTVQITDSDSDHSVSIPHFKSTNDGPSYFDLQIFPGLSTGTIGGWSDTNGVSTYVSGLHVGYYLQSPRDGMSVYLRGLDGASGKKIATKIIHDGIVKSGISVSSKLFSNNNVIQFALTKLGNNSENLAITSSTSDNIFGSNRVPFKFSVNSSVTKPVNIVNSLKNVKTNIRQGCSSSRQGDSCACIDPSFEPSSNFFCSNLEFNSNLGVYGKKGTKNYIRLTGGDGTGTCTSFKGPCGHDDNPNTESCYVRFCRNADPNHNSNLIYQANINSGGDNNSNGINSFIDTKYIQPPTLGRDGHLLKSKYVSGSGYGQYVQYQDRIFCKGKDLKFNNVGDSAGSPNVARTGQDHGVGVALQARFPNIKDTSTPSGPVILGFN